MEFVSTMNGKTIKDRHTTALSNLLVREANQVPHKLYEILKTYMDNKHRLYYDTPGFVGYDYNAENGEFTPQTITGKYNENGEPMFPIVCSTLVWLALMGVGFENCRMNTGNITEVVKDGVRLPQLSGGENVPYSGCKTIDLTEKEVMEYWGTSGHGTIYSSETARLFQDAGMLHKIKSQDFSDLMPGDILFFSNYVDDGRPTPPFLNINHVEMFVGWEGINLVGVSTYDGDSVFHTKRAKNSEFNKALKYYARIPCAGNPDVKKIGNSYGELPVSFVTGNNSCVRIDIPGGLEKERAYPVIIRLDGEKSGENIRFNIFPHNGDGNSITSYVSQVFVANKGQCIAPNTYYTNIIIPESFTENVGGFNIYCSANGDYSATITDVSVYDKLVQVG